MAYSKEKAKLRRRRENGLLKIISTLEQQLFLGRKRQSVPSERKQMLNSSNKLRGTIIRSRARWVGDGKKKSEYFLSLEKNNKSLNIISSLENIEGNVIDQHQRILDEIFNFCSSICSSHSCFSNLFLYSS